MARRAAAIPRFTMLIMNERGVWGFSSLTHWSHMDSILELGAGGALHPILKRERAQGVYHSFPACALPHFDRETPKPNPLVLDDDPDSLLGRCYHAYQTVYTEACASQWKSLV